MKKKYERIISIVMLLSCIILTGELIHIIWSTGNHIPNCPLDFIGDLSIIASLATMYIVRKIERKNKL